MSFTRDPPITMNAGAVARRLALIAVLLVIANILAQVLRYGLGHQYVLGFVREFDLNQEDNIPSYFSGLLLLSASGLLGVIARYAFRTENKKHWAGLSIIFLYMSFDEVAQLHETIGADIARQVGVQGVETYFVWLMPFSLLLILFAVSYLRFLWRLATYYRILFILSGVVYVGGAMGMEAVGGWYALGHGVHNPGYAICFTIEESMEMGGVIIFIYALLQYARDHIGGLLISFDGYDYTALTESPGAGDHAPGRAAGLQGYRPRRIRPSPPVP